MSDEPEVRAFMRHVRAEAICSSAARAWFGRHGLSWTSFLSEGVPASALEQTGDPFAVAVGARAREEATNG